ncbi:hypothetical protein [Alteribacter natronophilus]|uniref:hypothetical protein n=1 Tax=Alteribacter natronophilus TaxID=2583810 RepID=UPI00110DEE26|nr:hypothetical protein [Alteribacter natronophilus]TMW72922.1 hypothetical protein FGB90_01005 [Alteribacter natronophilus]
MLIRFIQYALIAGAAGLAVYGVAGTESHLPIYGALILLGGGFLIRSIRFRHHIRRTEEPDMIPYTFLKRYRDYEKSEVSKEDEENLRKKYSAKERKKD